MKVERDGFQTVDSPAAATSTTPGNWRTDIRAWVHRRRRISDEFADDIVDFFAQCFRYNACPDQAWFGVHKDVISLVAGGIFLGAVNPPAMSLLVDRQIDDLPEIKFTVVESTLNKSDKPPLIWADLPLEKLHHLHQMNHHAALWEAHTRASIAILGFPIGKPRDNVQRVRRKIQLQDLLPDRAISPPPALPDLPAISQALESEGAFDPASIEDARQRIERAIVQRQGQRKFRDGLLANYGWRCPITGCDLRQALEAAHIVPYQGAKTNDAANGLPLRADIHTLFDLYLLSIEPESRKVVIAPELRGSCYAELEGKVLAAPERGAGPAQKALEKHYREFEERYARG